MRGGSDDPGQSGIPAGYRETGSDYDNGSTLSACGVNQEHNTDSDIETVYEKQESDLQTEEAGISMPFQEEVSQEMELEEKDTVLQIQVQDSNHTIIFELNDSPAVSGLLN